MKTLFGAVRVRGPKEFNLHVSIADILDRWAVHGWRWTHLPFGEHRNPITGSRLKRMGTKRGWPDFILLSPAIVSPDLVIPGRAHFLELKRAKAELSVEQYELSQWMQANGIPYEVARDFKQALAVLKMWGAIRARVSA